MADDDRGTGSGDAGSTVGTDSGADAEREAERAELAQLREAAARAAADQADKDKAEREAERAELEQHRADAAARAAAEAKKVKAPAAKADKAAAGGEGEPVKKRSRVSRKWFGDAADAD